MSHPNAMPCRINGNHYPSHIAAAYALGVRPNTISAAIARGRPDRVGMNVGRIGNKNRGRKVDLFGTSFASRKDAAAALGLSRGQFSRLMDAGTPAAMDALLAAKMKADFIQRGAA